MRLNAVKMLGISITTDPKNKILEEVRKYLENVTSDKRHVTSKKEKPYIIVTPNSEQIVYAQQDSHFAQFLNQADVAIPDGVGILLAAKLLKSQIPNHNDQTNLQGIAGVDLMEDLVKMAAQRGYPVALIGGRGQLAVRTLECLQARYVQLNGWAIDAPEFIVENKRILVNQELGSMNYELKANNSKYSSIIHNSRFMIQSNNKTDDYFNQLARRINETNVKLVFVGLGAPKQEYFIEQLKKLLTRNLRGTGGTAELTRNNSAPLVLMSVGGSFDIISGNIPRAPGLLRSLHLEWLWRLILEPWRWKRQLALVRFMLLVFERKLHV